MVMQEEKPGKLRFALSQTTINTFSTVTLAVITFFYLLETSKIRHISEKALTLDLSPKVYIDTFKSDVNFNHLTNNFDIISLAVLKNVGRTEATNITISYNVKLGKMTAEEKIETLQFLFPGQTVQLAINVISVPIDQALLSKIQEYRKAKKLIDLSIITQVPKILLPINIKYTDVNNIKTEHILTFEFMMREKIWVISSSANTLSASSPSP